MNERMVYAPFPGQLRVNLESLVVANGLTEPLAQLATTTDFLCDGSPYSPFKHDDWRCKASRVATRPCLDMIAACYKYDNNATCTTATSYCWPVVQVSLLTGKFNYVRSWKIVLILLISEQQKPLRSPSHMRKDEVWGVLSGVRLHDSVLEFYGNQESTWG